MESSHLTHAELRYHHHHFQPPNSQPSRCKSQSNKHSLSESTHTAAALASTTTNKHWKKITFPSAPSIFLQGGITLAHECATCPIFSLTLLQLLITNTKRSLYCSTREETGRGLHNKQSGMTDLTNNIGIYLKMRLPHCLKLRPFCNCHMESVHSCLSEERETSFQVVALI